MTILLPEEHDIKREPLSRLQKWVRTIDEVQEQFPDLPSHARIKGIPYPVGEVRAEYVRRSEPKGK